MAQKRVVIVGGGPAGLMAASQLLDVECELVLVDHKSTVGRKFLVAGDGGFNLTHSEEVTLLVEKYDQDWVKNCVRRFTNKDFIAFLRQLGIPTMIGSSGKVFPKEEIKPIDVLNAWKSYLAGKVIFRLNTAVVGFSSNALKVVSLQEEEQLPFDYLVFAMGGKSWSRTGSDGAWVSFFEENGIQVNSFQASNSGLELYDNWLAEGEIIKNCVLSAGNQQCAGDVVCTKYGLEGKPVYAVNRAVRSMERPFVLIDFKPQMSVEKILQVLKKSKNPTQGLKALKLGNVALFWLKEFVSKEVYNAPEKLAHHVKHFRVGVKGFRPLEEVISCVGGVAVSALDEQGQLHAWKNVYCCGEMVDWDAPTGGYLIQACVSSGWVVGQALRQSLIDSR